MFLIKAARQTLLAVTPFVVFLAISGDATANYVTDGTFAAYTTGTKGQGQLGDYTKMTYWSTSASATDPYSTNFLYTPGTADTTGSYNPENNAFYKLAGPNDGSSNGLTSASPTGGNFLALDGDSSYRGMISQTINNLVAGMSYYLNFDWAGAQQSGYTGISYDTLNASLGNQTQSTATVTNVSKGFTGWMNTTMTFTATGSSEVLSFLSSSTPNGVPPYILLADISMNTVPEPSSVALVLTSLIAFLGFGLVRRFAKTLKTEKLRKSAI